MEVKSENIKYSYTLRNDLNVLTSSFSKAPSLTDMLTFL